VTRNKILIAGIAILLYCSILPILAYSVNASPTCNPAPTFWPADITGPTEWGEPCWADVADYTVYGQVTVGEGVPLEGAEVRVNRIVDGAQTGAGMAFSDANGEYRIGIAGHVDALRVYIIYPFGYEAWGVTSPVGSWGLELVHWVNPPSVCGPIWWKAAYLQTLTPTWTATPSRTPTWTATPTATLTPTRTATRTAAKTPTRTATRTQTPTATQTSVPTVTPTRAPFYLVVPPELRMTPAATSGERQGQVIILGVAAYNLLRLWTYIMATLAGLGVAQNVIKWKQK